MRLAIILGCVLLQLSSEAQFSVGHRAGIALSKWQMSGGTGSVAEKWNDQQSSLYGLFVEVPVEFALSQRFKLLSGVGFIQKGLQYKNADQHYRQGYLQWSIGAGYLFQRGHYFVQPELGAVYGYNMRGYYRWNFGGPEDWYSAPIGRATERGYPYWMPPHELSLQARLSIGYQWRRGTIGMMAGYQHGLSNAMIQYAQPYATYDNPEGLEDPAIPDVAHQRTVVLALSYSLLLCKRETPDSTQADSTRREPRFSLGQRFGVTRAGFLLRTNPPGEQARVSNGAEPLQGLSTALVASMRITTHLSLQAELAYTQRGWQCRWFSRPTGRNDIMRMNYLELPLLARVSMGRRAVKPYAIAGPVFARGAGIHHLAVIATPVYGHLATPIFARFNDTPEHGEYQLYDLGYIAGGGVIARTQGAEFFVDIRYHASLTDFVPAQHTLFEADDVDARHRMWAVSVGYLIPW